ncbi:hypothetical protein [Alkalitalea saponilacus]|uniref:Uncharacterized protein n=1 Tax=Alkalitalea saponilacus TaxID=889453 RepID=A0A1T5HI73_9BACT|nr:hypothetical protein [Alkalitalea saponilacus]ASB48162.1 hypothetical protein CDL62_02885 [Alkalitalea saponilacus]SKC20385.1 hypothetical protein SAMN03080601_02341 [Alkalitalea saponilacus]
MLERISVECVRAELYHEVEGCLVYERSDSLTNGLGFELDSTGRGGFCNFEAKPGVYKKIRLVTHGAENEYRAPYNPGCFHYSGDGQPQLFFVPGGFNHGLIFSGEILVAQNGLIKFKNKIDFSKLFFQSKVLKCLIMRPLIDV